MNPQNKRSSGINVHFYQVEILKNIKFHKTGNRIIQMCSLGKLAFKLPKELELKSDRAVMSG